VVVATMWLWQQCGCGNNVVVATMWLWQQCGCGNNVVVATISPKIGLFCTRKQGSVAKRK